MTMAMMINDGIIYGIGANDGNITMNIFLVVGLFMGLKMGLMMVKDAYMMLNIR